MQDFEKLGVFYLGKTYDLATKQGQAGPGPLRLQGPGHARRLRRHDRQRQDRPVPLPARRGGHRRHPGAGHRPQGRPRQPAAHLSRAEAGRLRTRGSTRTTPASAASARPSSRPSRRSCGRRAWPTGGRTARASSACATPPTSPSTRPAATPVCRCPSSSRSPRRTPAIRDEPELLRERVATHRHAACSA